MRLRRALAAAVEIWALLGGLVLAGVVALNVVSILGGLLGRPIPGDFELTEIGTAIAVFAFLPWCQLTRANVTADVFTMGASRIWAARMSLAGSLAALAVAGVLLWRMSLGLGDQQAYGYTTAILQIPLWPCFLPVLASLALLALAAVATLTEDAAAARGRRNA
ncbi:TRAP transporter small permease [Rhodovulum kholense]|uniref:TRAP transporter small permease protein n=1 Tax=Rhodovulum kholense TaxID=453584 RepID=A0A8E2VH83_9RHOB|nr:TRAP transporter small permease subunit [Rhodovulum kholense]PTW45239.1 tripartite ATP-independent transporter DctQ subunit [Rhodovulum kholense]